MNLSLVLTDLIKVIVHFIFNNAINIPSSNIDVIHFFGESVQQGQLIVNLGTAANGHNSLILFVLHQYLQCFQLAID